MVSEGPKRLENANKIVSATIQLKFIPKWAGLSAETERKIFLVIQLY